MNTILYDCLHYIQWIQNYETPDQETPTSSWSGYLKKTLHLITNRDIEIQQFLCYQLPWHMAVSNIDANYVALIQEESLEVRSKKENYSHLIAHATIPSDEYPHYRKLEWSPNCNFIIVSTSDGLIIGFDVSGDDLFTVRMTSTAINQGSVLPNGALVSLMCLNARMRNSEWLYEIIAIGYSGHLHCYHLASNNNIKEHHSFTFGNSLSVSAAVYDSLHNIIIVAFPLINCNLKDPKYKNGLSTWRLLNDDPYYKLVIPTNEELLSYKCDKNFSSRLLDKFYNKQRSIVVKLRVSPDGQYLACLHTCGSISLWQLPSLRLHKKWPLNEQLDAHTKEHYPVDVNWSPSQRLIIIRNDGSLSVYNLETMKNQLETLEFVDHRLSIANTCDIDKGFLILSSKSISFRRNSSNNNLSPKELPAEETDDNQLQVTPAAVYTKYSLLPFLKYIWNISNMQPVVKNENLVQKIYQLHCIKSISPEDMYARKINNEQYADALLFADQYNLDKDLVYQRQWANSEVSVESIENYLANVTDSNWVLQECCERSAESLSAMESLLKYGLQLTEFDTFISYKDEELTANLLSSKNFNNDTVVEFTDKQLDLLKMRTRLLLCYDRLCIYKKILEEADCSDLKYDKDIYQKFKTNNVVDIGILCGRQGNCVGVNLLLTHYGNEILPHYLQILDNIPETIPPSSYKYLLPKYDESNGEIILPEQKPLREEDWSEGGDLKRYVEPVVRKKPNEAKLTKTNIIEWYRNRIRCIEEKSGIIDYSLELLEIASSYNIPNLEKLNNDLFVLNQLVFDLDIDDVSLSNIERMTNMEKLKLLMQKATKETFVDDFKHIAIPFLTKCESLYAASRSTLLKEYFLELTNTNNLYLVRLLIRADCHIEGYEIFEDEEKMIRLALMCIYANRYPDQIDSSFQIVEDIRVEIDWTVSDVSLSGELFEVECELNVVLLLRDYGVEKTVSFIHENKTDVDVAKALLIEMTKFKLNRPSKSGSKELKLLLEDIIWLKQEIFNVLSTEACLEIFAFSLLTSDEIKYIQHSAVVLTLSPHNVITEHDLVLSYDQSVVLILDAARQYFNSAVTFYDNAICLAKACLNLIGEENPDIKEELELIRALEILHSFGVFMLPLQVRSRTEKFSIIKMCLNESLLAYKKTENLLLLAKCLRIFKNDHNSSTCAVLMEAAETAFNKEDYDECAKICLQLTRMGSSAQMAWHICKKFCQCDEYTDEVIKRDLILFTLLYCPENELLDVVRIRNQLERSGVEQYIRNTVSEQLEQKYENKRPTNVDDTASAANDRSSNESKSAESSNSDFIGGFIRNITTPSSELISLNFWKTTLGWNDARNYYQSVRRNHRDFSEQLFPSFYGCLHEHCNCYVAASETWAIDCDERLKFLLHLLKFYILSVQMDAKPVPTVRQRINEIIGQCCIHLAANDFYQLFCFLMSLDDLKSAEECFRLLPSTLLCKKLAFFYYIVRLGVRTEHIKPKQVLLYSPTSLIRFVRPLIDQFLEDADVKLLITYKEQVENFHDILQMQRLNCGIDVNRFYHDRNYRTDSILGLAMCSEKDKLQTAFEMSVKYDLPVEEVLISCLTFLFLNNEHNVLAERLSDDWFEKLLKQNSTSLSEKLKSSLYSLLDGCNFQSLILFYSILNIIDNDGVFHHLIPREHIKLLKKVKATSNSINYKLLTSEPPAILNSILSAINPNSVSNIVKFVKSLPRELKNIISPKEIYSALVKKTFPIYQSGALPLLQQLKLFERCCQYFQHMSKDDVIDFTYDAIFSPYSLNNRDLQMRKEFLNLSIESCRSVNFNFSKDLNKMYLYWEEYLSRLDRIHDSCEVFYLNEQLWRKLVFSVGKGSDCVNNFLEEISTELSDSQSYVRKCLISSDDNNVHTDHEIDNFDWEETN